MRKATVKSWPNFPAMADAAAIENVWKDWLRVVTLNRQNQDYIFKNPASFGLLSFFSQKYIYEILIGSCEKANVFCMGPAHECAVYLFLV